MRNKLQKGEITEGLLMILGIAIIVFVLLGHTGAPGANTGFSFLNGMGSGNSTNNLTSVSNPGITPPTKNSPYANQVHLQSGNAQYETQPFMEYITVQNDSNASVDVTGWTLSNGKGLRTYSVGSSQQTFTSDVVTIPRGNALVSSSSNLQDIVLKSGESLDVVTGTAGNTSPYKITSFKENECTGYLTQQNTYGYSFSPSLRDSCVAPRNEPSASNLDLICQNYIQNMQSCHTPKYNSVDSQGNVCNGCVDSNSGLSNACVAYIQKHFSYESCLANHESDSNFYGSIWHVYLGRSFELWAADHEVITLFDASGKVVDYLSY